MISESEKHDVGTFQDVLCDYLHTCGIEMPNSIQEVIVKKFFKPDEDFRPVCALQYGRYILFVPQKEIQNLQGFLFWDVRKQKIRRVLLNDCEDEKEVL